MLNPTSTFIDKSKAIHKDKNGNPKFTYPDNLYIRTLSQINKIELICILHGKTLIEPRHHLKNATGGCHKCRVEKSALSKIEKSKAQWEKDIIHTHLFTDGTPKYDYSEFIYTGRTICSTIICNKCKLEGRIYKFNQASNFHIDKKYGCPSCGIINNSIKLITPLNVFIEKCKEKHNSIYSYENIHKTYKSGNSVIEIYCKKCKIYYAQTAFAHIAGRGCHNCGFIKSGSGKLSNTTDFIIKAKEINNNSDIYDYTNTIYEHAKKKLNIKCNKCNNIFSITPSSHLRGHGCSKCNHHTSKKAREWLCYIQTSNNIILQTFDSIDGEYCIFGTNYKADGYHPVSNTIYEFNGNFWHGNPNIYKPDMINTVTKTTMNELYRKTIEKKEICISLGYNWVEIWEDEWDKIKKNRDLLIEII
jgi:hypothetical protein